MKVYVCLECYNQFDEVNGKVLANNGLEEFICAECAGA
jgi:hypothetical protein